jgi:hypothetical protein
VTSVKVTGSDSASWLKVDEPAEKSCKNTETTYETTRARHMRGIADQASKTIRDANAYHFHSDEACYGLFYGNATDTISRMT